MLSVRNLEYAYPGAPRPALHGLDFEVQRGEVFGFLGPSGAGKSTLQKILIGLIRGYSGAVTFQGREIREWSRDFYERIGVSFEFPNHFLKLTAWENLEYFGRLYSGATEPVSDLLDKVGLAQDAGKRVGQFSKGMKNRLSVARALLHRPQALFLDEPTAGLDPVNTRKIKELIQAERLAGRTVLLTTHDMGIADELCDRVAFIMEGRIPAIGRPRDLKLRYGQAKVRVEFRDRDGVGSVEAGSDESRAAGGGAGSGGMREFPMKGLGENADFLELLRGDRVETLHSLEPTLEDVFIRVTGRGLD